MRKFFTLLGTLGALIALGAAIGYVVAVATSPASAEERNPATNPDRGKWFKSLKQPDTGTTCCDVSDCKRTVAEYRDGSWWAKVRGVTRVIPPNKILIRPYSIDGDAYVCASEEGPAATATVYCFVPPDLGT